MYVLGKGHQDPRVMCKGDKNVQRFRGGLASKAQRLCVSLNSRLESNEEEDEGSKFPGSGTRDEGLGCRA
jgi:hypothetical protein